MEALDIAISPLDLSTDIDIAETPPRMSVDERRAAPRRAAAAARFWAGRTFCVLAVLTIATWAFGAGVKLRHALWTASVPLRFQADVANGFRWGNEVNELAVRNVEKRGGKVEGVVSKRDLIGAWLDFYPTQLDKYKPGDVFDLDYPPLRLLAVSLWVRHERTLFPAERGWRDELTTPMLTANLVAAALAAVGAFLLVRYWVWRGLHDPAADPLGPRPMFTGLAAALLVWFNAAVLVNSFAWPQWDTWIIPAFLWGAYLVSVDRALLAGMIVAVGALLKGQLLLVAPLFVLWPIFEGRPSSALHFVTGFAALAAAVLSPWMVRNPPALIFVGTAILGGMLIFFAPLVRRLPSRVRVTSLAVGACLFAWPWFNVEHFADWWIAGALAGTFLVAAIFMPGRAHRGVVALLLLAAVTVLAGRRFEGNWAWYVIGYEKGTDHYRVMAISVSNLPALLQKWGWAIDSPVDWYYGKLNPRHVADAAHPLELRTALRLIYVVLLVACSALVARHARRGDRHVLIALCAPWLIFFAILPQMHERYYVWSAGITAIAIGAGVGITILHLLATALSTLFMVQSMLACNPAYWPDLSRNLAPFQPDVGWLVVLIAAIFFVVSFRSSSTRHPIQFRKEI